MATRARRTAAQHNGAAPAKGRGIGRERPAAGTPRRELVENEIYEHASRLFAERGFAGTSLQDIADAMGMTRPALYYYVRNKDELLAKLVTEITEGPAADIAEITQRPDLDATEKLRALAGLIALRRASSPARFRLLVRSEAELPSDLAAAHEGAKRNVLREFTQVIDQGVVAGVFRPVDARTAALALIGMCNWVAWWHHPGDRRDDTDIADLMGDFAVAMVRQVGDRVPSGPQPAAALALLRQDLDYLERLLRSAGPDSATPAGATP